MSDANSFVVPGAAAKAIPSISDGIAAFADRFAAELMACGLTPRQACSVVANVLVREAWIVAAVGALAEGATPNPDLFRQCADDAIRAVKFKTPIPSGDNRQTVQDYGPSHPEARA